MNLLPSLLICTALSSCLFSCRGQKQFGSEFLTMEQSISLPGVRGRIDHMDVNLKDQIVYMAALGNNTLEAIDLKTGKVIYSIKGLDEPQGVGYIPQHQEIVVANGGTGDCYFYNASTFEKTATIHLSSDADDIRYDSTERKVYVGYGNGGIAVIDADTHKQSGDIKLRAHPEGFQIDKQLNRIYVNLPGQRVVGVIDLKEMKLVAEWPNKKFSANFPMAIDEQKHHVLIGYRHPPTLVIMDGRTGNQLSTNSIVGDTDDLYYDAQSNKVYISGGSGAVYIYEALPGGLKQIANISTRDGARTSLLIPRLRLLIVAARAGIDRTATVLVYRIPRNVLD